MCHDADNLRFAAGAEGAPETGLAGDADAPGEQQTLERVQVLIAALDGAPDEPTAGIARELLQLVLDAHAGALARLLALVSQSRDADKLLARMSLDGQVRSIMLLHGIHPEDTETRLRHALGDLGPRLAQQGVDVTGLEFANNGVRIALRCDRRLTPQLPDAAVVQAQIEEVVFEAAPDVAAIAVEGLPVLPEGLIRSAARGRARGHGGAKRAP